MTTEQSIIIDKVHKEIRTIRQMLDDVMYRVEWIDKLTENERKRVREAYDLICKANDKL